MRSTLLFSCDGSHEEFIRAWRFHFGGKKLFEDVARITLSYRRNGDEGTESVRVKSTSSLSLVNGMEILLESGIADYVRASGLTSDDGFMCSLSAYKDENGIRWTYDKQPI